MGMPVLLRAISPNGTTNRAEMDLIKKAIEEIKINAHDPAKVIKICNLTLDHYT